MQQRWFWTVIMALIFGLMFMRSNITMLIFMVLIGAIIGYLVGQQEEKGKKPPK